ncbi:hypothetical protein [Ktedonospora formicarum]|uniref:Uncharacterized protein n=1 Tax=Ktedonospora formicarum TaxID=2778364 RepID=A0A8J3I245_9CHLR|nr:hypothetical protein [Ktedonospora formicarum]GHO44074.1 hypothetical protein KSX_22370 [Ktedonospora formicarum]
MKQPASDMVIFHMGRAAYHRTRLLAISMAGIFFLGAIGCILGCIWMWSIYSHEFTLYLKWQDALVGLLGFIAFAMLKGDILIARFLYALHRGYRHGMFLVGKHSLEARDLSPLNLSSIFWMLNSEFWCFVAVLVGLVPAILVGWTLHITHPLLMVVATGAAILLSLAGVAVSVVAFSFILIGCVGAISFTKNLGAVQTYELSNRMMLRIDDFQLTIIYPGAQESLIELKLLDKEDRRVLLDLLHARWIDAQHVWNPRLGEEIEQALRESERSAVLV